MCPPIRAHWRHLANVTELVLPSAHFGKSICSAVFAQLTQKLPILYNGRPIPQQLPLPTGDLEPIKHMIPWPHPRPDPGVLVNSAVFAQMTAECPYTCKGKEEYLYNAFFGQGGTLKALRRGSHSFTCK